MPGPGPYDPPSPFGAPPAREVGVEPLEPEAGSAGEPEILETAEEVQPHPPVPPPPRRGPAPAPALTEITPQDRDFMQRVFLQVRDVDFRAPPPPPPRRDLAGPDKKIAQLRHTVHELERDLARVGFIWGAVQHQYDAADRLIAAKEVEREAAVSRYGQIKELAAQTAARDRAENAALERQLADLEAQRTALEGDLAAAGNQAAARLQKVEQEKVALVTDFRAKMEAAQQAFNQLREQSARTIADFESRLAQREETLASHAQAHEDALTTISERDAEIDTLRGTMAAREHELADLRLERDRLAGLVDERTRTLSTLAEEMSHVRAQHERAQADLRDALSLKDELIESTRKEVRSARAEFNQLAEQYELRRVEVERLGKELGAASQELERIRGELASRESALGVAHAALVGAQEDARLARADAQAMSQQLAAVQK